MWRCKICGRRFEEHYECHTHFTATGHNLIYNEDYYTKDGCFLGKNKNE